MVDAKLKFFGGVGATTGANIMFEFSGKKILVDCGLRQGGREAEKQNLEPFGYNPKNVDFLFITHAHIDHIGRVPKLVKEGFNGKIFSTQETKELALPMLKDAIKVFATRHKNELYSEPDIEKSMGLWQGKNYGEKFEIFPGCDADFLNAGHVLGSSIVVLTFQTNDGKKRLAFTGDLGNNPSPLLPDTEIPEMIDVMVMESVYGDRNHESKEERRNKFKQAILDGIQRGGDIVIPAFSVERTQVLLYELNNMVEDGEIPNIPVFLDSPLAQKVTLIYKKYQSDFKKSVQNEINSGDDIFDFPNLQITRNFEESDAIQKIKVPKIILAGSGMSEGGRVVNHEARILDDNKNTLILVGYQSLGSLGRKLMDGAKEITLPPLPYAKEGQGNKNFERIKVKAKIVSILGYSSHMDSDHLVEFVANVSEKRNSNNKKLKVFVIMGEPKSSLFLAQHIRDYLGIEAVYPEEGREYDL